MAHRLLAPVALVALLCGVAEARKPKRRVFTEEELTVALAPNVAVVRVMGGYGRGGGEATAYPVEIEESLRGFGVGPSYVVFEPPARRNGVSPNPDIRKGKVFVVALKRKGGEWVAPACCQYEYSEERKLWVAEISSRVDAAQRAKREEEERLAAQEGYRGAQDAAARTAEDVRRRARLEREAREAADATKAQTEAERQRKVIENNVIEYTARAEVVVLAKRVESTVLKDGGVELTFQIEKTLKGKWNDRKLHLAAGTQVSYWNLIAPVTLDRSVLVFADSDGDHLRLVADDAVVESDKDWIDLAVKAAKKKN